jgi:hypothetical protein
MPSSYKYKEGVSLDDSYDIEHIDYDEDGNPFIIPEAFNLTIDRDQNNWYEVVEDDVIDIWTNLMRTVDEKCIPMLEYATFTDFAIFVAKHSHKTPPKLYKK